MQCYLIGFTYPLHSSMATPLPVRGNSDEESRGKTKQAQKHPIPITFSGTLFIASLQRTEDHILKQSHDGVLKRVTIAAPRNHSKHAQPSTDNTADKQVAVFPPNMAVSQTALLTVPRNIVHIPARHLVWLRRGKIQGGGSRCHPSPRINTIGCMAAQRRDCVPLAAGRRLTAAGRTPPPLRRRAHPLSSQPPQHTPVDAPAVE